MMFTCRFYVVFNVVILLYVEQVSNKAVEKLIYRLSTYNVKKKKKKKEKKANALHNPFEELF